MRVITQMKTSETKTAEIKSIVCYPVIMVCLLSVVAAICVSIVMLISYTRDTQQLRETKAQYEEIRKEYKTIAEKNDPSQKNKTELSNNEIKRKLAGQAEDEEQEILESKFKTDSEIEKRLNEIDSFLNSAD